MARTLWLAFVLAFPLLGGCRLFDVDDDWDDEYPCESLVIDDGSSAASPSGQVLPGPAR